MLGKSTQASMRPNAMGAQIQTSVYGSTIPNVYGCSRSSVALIWTGNLQSSDVESGKKVDKKANQKLKVYTEAADFMLGSNPILDVMRIWSGKDLYYPMRIIPITLTVASGSSPIITWTDVNNNGKDTLFYNVVAVAVETKFQLTVEDYGGTGEVVESGHHLMPLWNIMTSGPDPTDPHGSRMWPFVYRWMPGDGKSIVIPGLELGLFDPWVPNPASIELTIWTSVLDIFDPPKVPDSPLKQMRLEFEARLGSGNAYVMPEQQQQVTVPPHERPPHGDYEGEENEPEVTKSKYSHIVYPMFAGICSPDLDLGAADALPSIRPEVLGSYPLYPEGDCDYVDIVEDIFKAAIAQSAYGYANTTVRGMRGLPCYDYPGAIQKVIRSGADGSKGSLHTIPYDLGNVTGHVLLAAASVASGGSTLTTPTDTDTNTWVSVNADPSRSAKRQFWYVSGALGTPNIDLEADPPVGFTQNIVTFNTTGTDVDVAMLELLGVTALDGGSPVVVHSPNDGKMIGEITVGASSYVDGYPIMIVSWLFGADPTAVRATPPLKNLISTRGPSVYDGTKPKTLLKQRWDYCTVNHPGTFKLGYTGNPPSDWTLVLIAFKATTPPALGKALGNILDRESLELCRQQCRANNIFGSLVMDSQKKAGEWLAEIYAAMNVAPVWSGFSLKSVPYSEVSRAGANYAGVYVSPTATGPVADLGESDFIAGANEPVITIQRKARVDSPTLFQMQHPQRNTVTAALPGNPGASMYNDLVTTEPNAGVVSQYGPRKASPVQFRSVYERKVASMLLGIVSRRENVIRNIYAFKLHARWKLLEPMDLVTITDPLMEIDHLPVRLTSVNEDKDFNLECEAEPFIYGLNAFIEGPIADNLPYAPDKLRVPDSVNTPVFIEAVPGLLPAPKNEMWIGISDADEIYGGFQVYASADGGENYERLGIQFGNAITGVLELEWPQHGDPDTVNDLAVDLTESKGELFSYTEEYEDQEVYPCYVEGGNEFVPYELMSYALADMTDQYKFTLVATDGYHLHRGIDGTPRVAHAIGNRFLFLDPKGAGIFKFEVDPAWIGQTIYFKFCAFNKYGHGLQSLTDATPYPYLIKGTCWSGVPDQLYVNALEPSHQVVIGILANKWQAFVFEGELRAKLVQGDKPDYVDLRTISEGGTLPEYEDDPSTGYLVLKKLNAGAGGVNYQFQSELQGRWYYAGRLRNFAGWSVWSDGNNLPMKVTNHVVMLASVSNDAGPPQTTTINGRLVSGGLYVEATRPAINGKQILGIVAQVRDESVGQWRELDENVGASVVHYDGSAIDHVYDKSAGTITAPTVDFPVIPADSMILFDVRNNASASWDNNWCQWGGISADMVSGRVISGVPTFRPYSLPDTGQQWLHIRIKIVKAPWAWNEDGYLGAYSGNGIAWSEYWSGGREGDRTNMLFYPPVIELPEYLQLGNRQVGVRVWFDNKVCRGLCGQTDAFVLEDTGNPWGAHDLVIETHDKFPSVTKGMMRLRFKRDTINYKNITTVSFWLSDSLPAEGPFADERTAHPDCVLEEGTCTVTAGDSAVPVTGGRTPDPSVIMKVLLIYTEDADPDDDLDGNLITAEDGNGFTAYPFGKSGTFSYAVVKPWWDSAGGQTTNLAYYDFRVPDQTGGDRESLEWTTDEVPLPPVETFFATGCSRNPFGLGSEMTCDPEGVGGGTDYCLPLEETDPIVADCSLIKGTGKMFLITLTGNRTLNAINGGCGQPVAFLIRQGAGGGHGLTLGSMFATCDQIPDIQLSTAEGEQDLLGALYYEGTEKFNLCAFVTGFAAP